MAHGSLSIFYNFLTVHLGGAASPARGSYTWGISWGLPGLTCHAVGRLILHRRRPFRSCRASYVVLSGFSPSTPFESILAPHDISFASLSGTKRRGHLCPMRPALCRRLAPRSTSSLQSRKRYMCKECGKASSHRLRTVIQYDHFFNVLFNGIMTSLR